MHPITQAAGGGAVFFAALALAATGAKFGEELSASTVPTVDPAPVRALTIDIGARCAEDSPCWTWSRMGIRQRGVIVNGAARVVSPCTYRKLRVAGLIDARTEHLRGDAWAMKHGCGDDASVSVHPTGVVEG